MMKIKILNKEIIKRINKNKFICFYLKNKINCTKIELKQLYLLDKKSIFQIVFNLSSNTIVKQASVLISI